MELPLALVLLGLNVICVVASAWFARKSNVRELENDLSEVADIVEKIHRESRRAQMRRVRAAASETEFPIPPGAEVLSATQPGPVTLKAALRRQVFGGNKQ